MQNISQIKNFLFSIVKIVKIYKICLDILTIENINIINFFILIMAIHLLAEPGKSNNWKCINRDKEKWVCEYMKNFEYYEKLTPELKKRLDQRKKEDIYSIFRNIYNTRFPLDYDPSPDGIELSRLRKWKDTKLEGVFLDYIFYSGTPGSVTCAIEYIRKYRLKNQIYNLEDVIKRVGTSIMTYGHDAEKTLKEISEKNS